MIRRRAIRDWSEQDAFTEWRKVLFWHPHQRRYIKRRAAKQERRDARTDITYRTSEERYGEPARLPRRRRRAL